MYRLDGPLFYANAERVLESMRRVVDGPDVRWFVPRWLGDLRCRCDRGADACKSSPGATARGIGLALVDLIAGVRDTPDRAGVLERVGPQMVFDTAEDAVSAFRASAD